MKRVLLIGATGEFGSRLARHLARLPEIDLIVTSRRLARAQAAARDVAATTGGARVSGLAFDRAQGVAATLLETRPWLVIDASGPFQGANFTTARAAIEAGAHWIDLADARDYILSFPAALDALARAKGVAAFTGASSTPALSDAAVRALTLGWQRIDTIDLAIFPAGKTRVGRAVLEAVLSYAGSPVTVWREGRFETVTGWGSLERRHLPHFGIRSLSPVETADADLLAAAFAVTSRVAFCAGLESRFERSGMLAIARLRRRGWLGDVRKFAPILEKGRSLTRLFASNDGGMAIDVRGLGAHGKATVARWFLLAERGDGPYVPVMAALALTRKLLLGLETKGATIAGPCLTLAEIEAEMAPLALTTSVSHITTEGPSQFEAACSSLDYRELPAALRAFHDVDAPPVWEGRATVESGQSPFARLIRRVFGFAHDGVGVPVVVSVERSGGVETWTRNFAGRRFTSHLTHEGGNMVREQFWPFSILLGVHAAQGRIVMPVAGWRFLGLPLPRALAPRSLTSESQDSEGRFCFDVRISAPLTGLIVHYRGWLKPKPSGEKTPSAADIAISTALSLFIAFSAQIGVHFVL